MSDGRRRHPSLDARSIAGSGARADSHPRPADPPAGPATRCESSHRPEEDTTRRARTDLLERVARGEYVVDSRAVAEAMLERFSPSTLLDPSRVLEAGQLDGSPVCVQQPSSGPSLDAP